MEGRRFKSADLTRRARQAVKGFGRYVGWTLIVIGYTGQAFLRVQYVKANGKQDYAQTAL